MGPNTASVPAPARAPFVRPRRRPRRRSQPWPGDVTAGEVLEGADLPAWLHGAPSRWRAVLAFALVSVLILNLSALLVRISLT